MHNDLALFEEKEIRKIWEDDKWYFSVVDIIYVLTNSNKPRDYWYHLKQRVSSEEKIELSTICRQLKMKASNGKMYNTECADTEGILRIIQSIPSPKAEPFKRWLSKVGRERIEEINNPELAMDRMKKIYEKKGYSTSWIEQRERGIITRHNLTDEWRNRGAKNKKDYAILTNEIYKSGFGLSAQEYKKIKGINQNQNLRDSMTNLELALTNLGEASAKEFHVNNNSLGLEKLKLDVLDAGSIINISRKQIEEKLKRPVVTSYNYQNLTSIESKVLDD